LILEPGVEVSCSVDRKVKSYASYSNFYSPDRRGRPALASESFHPHGRQYQVDLERTRSYLRRALAPQRIWSVPLPLSYSRRMTNAAGERRSKGFAALDVKLCGFGRQATIGNVRRTT
jgi:hypothetical protein